MPHSKGTDPISQLLAAKNKRSISSSRASPDSARSKSSSGPPQRLVKALIQKESSGNPNAVSEEGATGLAQAMKGTAEDPGFGVRPLQNRRDSEESRRFAKDYLGAMMDEFQDPEKALMAYNWGPTNVKEWMKNGGDPSAVPDETKDYVRDLLPVAAKSMSRPVESTIIGKKVGDKERGQAKNAREKMRKQMMMNAVQKQTARRDDTRTQGLETKMAKARQILNEPDPQPEATKSSPNQAV